MDDDCHHEIKGRLLLGRKAMTNWDSVLKSRDVTLLTKVYRVKAMVFPVVMYGCESWTIKKAENWRIDAFELWCWRRLLRVPWTVGRSNLTLKEISLLYSRTDAEDPKFWSPDVKSRLIGKDPDAGKMEGRRRRGWQRMRWLGDITESIGMSFSKLWEIVKDRKSCHAVVHGVAKSQIGFSDWASVGRFSDWASVGNEQITSDWRRIQVKGCKEGDKRVISWILSWRSKLSICREMYE